MRDMNKKTLKFDGAAPLPIAVYLITIAVSLMYTICRKQFLPCALIMSLLTAGIFLLFYKLRYRPRAEFLTVMGMIVASWTAMSAAASWSPSEDVSFTDFLFSSSAQFEVPYAAAAIFVFSAVIGFVGFYFSISSPRPCFLMLPSFIPLILSARTSRELPVGFMAAMAGGFLWACANSAQYVPNTTTDPAWRALSASAKIPEKLMGAVPAVFEDSSGRRRRIAISLAAAAVIALIAAVIPRNTDTPFKDQLDSMVPQQGGYNYNAHLTNFANHSSVNTGMNQVPATLPVLFTVKTDHPGNLKRWAFDIYGEDGWTVLDDFNTGYPGWEYNAQVSDGTALLSALLEEKSLLSEENQALLEGLTASEPTPEYMTISIKDGSSARVVIHPRRMTRALMPEQAGVIYRTPRGDYFTKSPPPENATYYIAHYTGRESREFLRRLDRASFEELLRDAVESDVITQSMRSALIEELYEAIGYRDATALDDGITPEIAALAQEITSGAESDLDKALALEKWFGEAGFVYDLEFVPEEPGTEYFLFDSRRGICSDYASALTLLARAAGLPARYCEGFSMSEKAFDPETGLYEITAKYAHAWTQIYLPGGGWLDFDGTKYAEPVPEPDNSTPLWLYIAAGAAVLLLVILIFHRPLGWALFVLTYPLRSASSKITGVYLRTRALAAMMTGADETALSTGEVSDILSKRLSMSAEAEEICSAADRLFYSGTVPEADGKRLMNDLKALKKRRRRLK